jgi:hypothetical protein
MRQHGKTSGHRVLAAEDESPFRRPRTPEVLTRYRARVRDQPHCAQRPGDAEFRLHEVPGRRRNVTFERNNAIARLVSIYTAEMSRHANRSADVAAELQRCHSRGQCCSRTARRSADGTLDVPWIARQAEQRIARLMIRRTGRQICLAENHGATLTYFGDRRCISKRPVVAQLLKSARRRHADDLEGVLDRHRYAMQRAEIDATREGLIGYARLLARPPLRRARRPRCKQD